MYSNPAVYSVKPECQLVLKDSEEYFQLELTFKGYMLEAAAVGATKDHGAMDVDQRCWTWASAYEEFTSTDNDSVQPA